MAVLVESACHRLDHNDDSDVDDDDDGNNNNDDDDDDETTSAVTCRQSHYKGAVQQT